MTTLPGLDDFRKIALDTRPDLKAAVEAMDKAQTDHKLAVANGSTDPTLSAWYTHNSSNNNPFGINTLGVSVSFPLRIFDRNQGEKLRTQLDITRNREIARCRAGAGLQRRGFGYATLDSTLILLRPYKDKYLQQSVRVRDTVAFAYQHGGASLLDFLNVQSEYRSVQLSYVNLVGSYSEGGQPAQSGRGSRGDAMKEEGTEYCFVSRAQWWRCSCWQSGAARERSKAAPPRLRSRSIPTSTR